MWVLPYLGMVGRWKNLQDRRKDIRLTMLYKIINEIANLSNKEILIPADTRIRNRHGHGFHIMTKNTNEYKYSFFPRIISKWNCLPKALVDNGTVDAFKHGLKDPSGIDCISIYTPIGVFVIHLFRFRFRSDDPYF